MRNNRAEIRVDLRSILPRSIVALTACALVAGLAAANGNAPVQLAAPSNVALVQAAPNGVTPPRAGTPKGITLRAMTGTTIRKAGTVIDARDISGSIVIAASNVTISRCRIHGSGEYGVYVRSGSVKITNTTISLFSNGVAGNNYTADRVEVARLRADGFKLGSNVLIQNSWCHALTPAPGAHADCAQLQSGETRTTVRYNWFDPGARIGNSALFLAPDLGPSSNGPLTIQGNVLGGGNYALFCVDGNNGRYLEKHITITYNRFIRDSKYGPFMVNVAVSAAHNIWDSSRGPIYIR